jgi:hypothetical protein
MVKMWVGVYFSGALWLWDTWASPKKSAKLPITTKIPIFTYSTRLRSTQNLVEDLFLCILFNFEVKRTFFGKSRKKIQDDDFYPNKSLIEHSYSDNHS